MTNVSFNFSGKSVLVTGGTSGIGEAVAKSFVESGATVVITGRNLERGSVLIEKLSKINPKSIFIPGDITDSTFCQSLVDQAAEQLGNLDIVVNCAGIIYHANAQETTDAQWHETMNVNVNGTFFVCRAALSYMTSTGGVILNIASHRMRGSLQAADLWRITSARLLLFNYPAALQKIMANTTSV